MRCRRWTGAILFALLVSASLLGTVEAADDNVQLGIVRSYTPGDLEAKASDVAAHEEMGYAMVTRGDDGVIVWDLETGKAQHVMIPSRSWAVSVEMAREWLLVADVTGRLHGVNPELGKISWSKTIFETGSLRTTAVDDGENRMAFVGFDKDFRMTIEMVFLADLNPISSWSEDIPEEMASATPTTATWLPTSVVSGWNSPTLLIGTNEGQIYSWRGSGDYDEIVDLEEEVVGLAWDNWMGRLIAVTDKGRIYTIDMSTQQVKSQFTTEFTSPRSAVSFDYMDQQMAVGGSDGQIEIWEMDALRRTQTIRHHNYSLADVAWVSEDHLVSAGRFAKLVSWAPDTDGDLRADTIDAFPTDASEWKDTDDDGVGDNRDMFVIDPLEWWDTDGDGVGDNGDVFPKDPSEWADSDGDGRGDNGDFIPGMHNMVAGGLFMVVVAVAAALPVVRVTHIRRKGQRRRREVVMGWLKDLEVSPVPEMISPNGRDRIDHAYEAFRIRDLADPPRLNETVESYDTTVLNTIVALRVQDEVAQRSGIGADAAISRAVHLRDQLQELDGERERLDEICKSYWKVQDDVDAYVKRAWPAMRDMKPVMLAHEDQVHLLDNTLEQFRKSSLIKIGDEASKVSRGAYVVAAKEVRLRGAERPLGVKVGVPPRPEVLVPEVDEKGEQTPLSLTPPIGRLRTRQAMLIREDTTDLVVTVDNTLADDVEELAVDFSIAGDRLRHKGPHKVELGTLVTGRSAAATFQVKVVPTPPSDEEPEELTRILARVTGKAGTRRIRQELPAKTTNLVSSTLVRPSEFDLGSGAKLKVGRRGVRFPRVPSIAVLNALEFPHGMLPLMDGSMEGGGTWHIFVSTTDADEPLMVLVGVETRAEWVDLLVEVRGPPRFPSKELAEEVIDSVRFAILSDKRLRLRGEDKPLPADKVRELGDQIAKAYIGHADEELVERAEAA